MEIIPRHQLVKGLEEGTDTHSLEGCILELNRQLSKAKEGDTYVGIQAVLPSGDFGVLLGQLHVAGYNPSWQKLNWGGEEDGEIVYNIRVPLDEERDKFFCGNCGGKLTPLHFLGGDGIQFEGALALGFFGGYGMYLEARSPGGSPTKIPGATTEAILCEDCVHQLALAFPALGAILSKAPQY